MNKINYFFNFINSYRYIFLQVLFYEIFYSIKFRELVPNIKIQDNKQRTDTVPCVYYFLHLISNFLKKNKINSIIDVGSGYGRVVNFISSQNNIKSYGIEYDKEVHKKALKIKKKNVKLYCGDIFKFNLKKLNSNCFILIDPFKKNKDKKKFFLKLERILKFKKKYFIAVNFNGGSFPKGYNLIFESVGSNNRSLKIFEIN